MTHAHDFQTVIVYQHIYGLDHNFFFLGFEDELTEISLR